jgi:general secretion pathway protein I
MKKGELSQKKYPSTKWVGGFGLLEALVAMAIASIAIGVLYKVVAQSAKNSVEADKRVQATLVARSVYADGVFVEDFTSKMTGRDAGWNWKIDIAPVEVVPREFVQNTNHKAMRFGKLSLIVSLDASPGFRYEFVAWKAYRSAQ